MAGASRGRSMARRLLEAGVIVGSILLAFAIDAAWDERQEREREVRLLAAIEADLEETRSAMADLQETLETRTEMSRELLRAWAAGFPDGRRDELLGRTGSIFIMGGWSPVNVAYDEAVASGTLSLIRDDELRRELARLASVYRLGWDLDRNTAQQYYAELEPWMVENAVYSEIAAEHWRDVLVLDAPFRTDFDALARDRALWNLVTLKLELDEAFLRQARRALAGIEVVEARLAEGS